MDQIPVALETLVGASDSTMETCSLCIEGRFGSSTGKFNCFAVDKLGLKVFSGSDDNAVRVYDSQTCEPVHVLRGHTAPVFSLVSLDNARLVSASRGDGTLRLWNVETGEELAKLNVKKPKNVARLSGDTVIISDWQFNRGITFTKIQFHLNGEITRRIRRSMSRIIPGINIGFHGFQGTLPFPTFLSYTSVGSVSASGENFAAVCYDYPLGFIVRVWDSQSMSQRHEINVFPGVQPILALNEKHLVRTSFRSLVVYDVNTLEEILTIRLPFTARSVQFTHSGNLIATHGKGRVLFHSVSSGSLVCEADFVATAPPVLARFELLPDESIVFKTRGCDEIVRCQVRQHLPDNSAGPRTDDAEDEDLPPLQAGLLAVMQGSASAGDQCTDLISKEMCEASLSEWYAAHQLLVIAINEGTVDQSPHFRGNLYWWMEQLYATVAMFPQLSKADRDDVKICLRDAHALKVLPSPDAVVLGVEIMNSVRTDLSVLKKACIRILERVLMVEGRFEDLKEAFFAYRRCQQYMNIIGIAVQLIPIAGGAVAGVLSAGADIVSGLSVKDLVDYAFQGGGPLVTEVASRLLTQEALAALDPERRQQLVQLFEECGFTCGGVQKLLRNAREGRRSGDGGEYEQVPDEEDYGSNLHEPVTGAGPIDVSCGTDETNNMETSNAETSNTETSNTILELGEQSRTVVDGTVTHEPLTTSRTMSASAESLVNRPGGASPQATTTALNVSENAESLSNHGQEVRPQVAVAIASRTYDETDGRFRRPSEFRDVDLSTHVQAMETAELAGLWSAFVLRFNDDRQEDHILLARCLHRALEEEDIHGEDMCEFSESDRCSLLQSVLEILDCERGISIPLGRRHRLQRFLQVVNVG